MRRIILMMVMLMSIGSTFALELPEIIGSHMMLQQKANARLWGWAKAGSKVTVTTSWNKHAVTATAQKDGRWVVEVPTPEASYDVQQITVKGDGETVVIDDVLIGEVWFCSGQSNMVMPLKGLRNCPVREGHEEIATSAQWANKVRVALIPQDQMVAHEPQQRVHGKWYRPNPKDAPEFGALAWFYATMLTQILDVPVGVIVCAWGGSRIEGWLPEWYIRQNAPEEDLSLEFPKGNYYTSMDLPMSMYNGMLHPVIGYTIRGFLWNQGEANINRGQDTYPKRFTDLVSIWRKEWNQPGWDLPFYTVEMPPYWYRDAKGQAAATFRTMQWQLAESVENCGCVCTNDLLDEYEMKNVHGSLKRPIGQRMAYLAAVRTYGYEGIQCDAPMLESVALDGGKAMLTFKNAGEGFSRFGDIKGFELMDSKGEWHEALGSVTAKYNILKVECDSIGSDIKGVRYNYYNWSPASRLNSNTYGQPIVPFQHVME